MISIPDSVLLQMITHRPHLAVIDRHLRADPSRAAQFEKALADAYLAGESRLSPMDTWRLSKCCVGDKFGGGSRESVPPLAPVCVEAK